MGRGEIWGVWLGAIKEMTNSQIAGQVDTEEAARLFMEQVQRLLKLAEAG